MGITIEANRGRRNATPPAIFKVWDWPLNVVQSNPFEVIRLKLIF